MRVLSVFYCAVKSLICEKSSMKGMITRTPSIFVNTNQRISIALPYICIYMITLPSETTSVVVDADE